MGGRERTREIDEVAEWLEGWRVEEWTKKVDPAVNNPPIAVPKPKSEGNEGVKVGSGGECIGRMRDGEEPVPILHGQVEGLDVEGQDENREGKQEVGRAGGSEGGRAPGPPPPPKPEKEVRDISGRGSTVGGEANQSGKGYWKQDREGIVEGNGW